MKTLKDLYNEWEESSKPFIIEVYGSDDEIALSEDWNNFTDAACKDGDITDLQYNHCPAYDEDMPDDDIDYLLDCLNLPFTIMEVSSRADGLMEDAYYHYRFRFGDNLSGYFSTGSAHTYTPDASTVLECILNDSRMVRDCDTFEEFASEMGYDEDSRQAERIYDACVSQSEQVCAVLTNDEVDELLDMIDEL